MVLLTICGTKRSQIRRKLEKLQNTSGKIVIFLNNVLHSDRSVNNVKLFIDLASVSTSYWFAGGSQFVGRKRHLVFATLCLFFLLINTVKKFLSDVFS